MLKFRSFLAKRLEYQLTVFSLSTFSIPTIILFPDTAIKYGLSKFLAVYIILSIFLILPLLLIEFFFFDRRVGKNFAFARPVTQIKAWRSWPFGRLIGSCQIVISLLLLIYYSQILWPILVHTIVSPKAPWAQCNNLTLALDASTTNSMISSIPDFKNKFELNQYVRENTGSIPDLTTSTTSTPKQSSSKSRPRSKRSPQNTAKTSQIPINQNNRNKNNRNKSKTSKPPILSDSEIYCFHNDMSLRNQSLITALNYYSNSISNESKNKCLDPYVNTLIYNADTQKANKADYNEVKYLLIFLTTMFCILTFPASLQVRGAAWLGIFTVPISFSLFSFLALKALSIPGSITNLQDHLDIKFIAENFNSFSKFQNELMNNGLVSRVLAQILLQLNGISLGIGGCWRSGVLPGKHRRSAPIFDLLCDCLIIFIFTSIGGMLITTIICMMMPVNHEMINLPVKSLPVMLSLVNYIPIDDLNWSTSETVSLFSQIISTLILVQCTMSILPVINVFHSMIVELLGAHANTCTKDGQSQEEIMAKSNPNKCCLGGEYFFSSCLGRYIARLLSAILIVCLTLGLMIGLPCLFSNFNLNLPKIQLILTEYIWPLATSTMTLAILIGIFIPITTILSSHKNRRNQNSGSSYVTITNAFNSCIPILVIILLSITLLPALLCFITSYYYIFKSDLFTIFTTSYIIDPVTNFINNSTDTYQITNTNTNLSNSSQNLDIKSTNNIISFAILLIIPVFLIILLVLIPCISACIATNRKLNKIRKINKKNHQLNSPNEPGNSDKYDTLLTNAEDQYKNSNHHSNPNHPNANNYHDNNFLENERLNNLDYDVYSSLSHRQSQTKNIDKFGNFYWLKIFLRSMKYSFIPPEEAGVSDNLIAAGQSYHTLDRYEKNGVQAEMIPTDQFNLDYYDSSDTHRIIDNNHASLSHSHRHHQDNNKDIALHFTTTV